MTGAVLFYVQHLLGIGHLRRALHLVGALARRGHPVTLVSGGERLPELAGAAAERVVQLAPVRARDASFKDLVDGDGRPVDDRLRAARRRHCSKPLRRRGRCRDDRGVSVRPPRVPLRARPADRRRPSRRPRAPVLCSVRDIVVAPADAQRRRDIVDRVRADFDTVLVHGDPA